MKVFGAVMIAWCVAAVTGDASSAEHTDRRPHRYRQPPPNAGDGGGATYHWPALDVGLDAKKTGVPVGPHGAAPTSKAVFAHYMLCFAAFGEKGNSSNATSGPPALPPPASPCRLPSAHDVSARGRVCVDR